MNGHWRRCGCRRCDAAPWRIVRFPKKPLCIQALLESIRTVDPCAVAVGKGGPVVGLTPDEKSARGLLDAIACSVVVLGFKTLAYDVVADEVEQRLEAEYELAIGGMDSRGGEER